MSKFPENLKTLRKARGLTQDELAAQLCLKKSTISMYEGGNREPNFETMEAIADFFNVSLASLMGETCEFPVLAADEALLIREYRNLNAYGKEYIRQTVALTAKLVAPVAYRWDVEATPATQARVVSIAQGK